MSNYKYDTAMHYYLFLNGQKIGPMTAHQLFAYDVNPNVSVSCDGINWNPLYTYPELMEIYHNQPAATGGVSDINSKKILCGIMAILFGTLGVQYFICGKTTAGIITILLSLVTCGAWEVITFIQGILMLCMSDADFKRKYIDSTSTLPLF